MPSAAGAAPSQDLLGPEPLGKAKASKQRWSGFFGQNKVGTSGVRFAAARGASHTSLFRFRLSRSSISNQGPPTAGLADWIDSGHSQATVFY